MSKTGLVGLLAVACLVCVGLLGAQAAWAQEGEVEPASVPGFVPFAAVQSLSAGEEGNCVVTPAKALFCWGNGSNGRNGTGSNLNLSTPAAVTALSNVLGVNRGGVHSCAVVQGNSLSCWGANGSGQLGTGDTSPSTTPVSALLDSVANVAVGGSFTCARRTNGEVWCWGDNTYGQLGVSSTGGANTNPVHVEDIAGVTAIDAGTFHTCALLANGEVWCWGNNSSGQIGNGAFALDVNIPVKALLPEPVVQITAGGSTTCARTAAGKVYCWGENGSGQVGAFDAPSDHNAPIVPQSLETAIAGIDTNGSTTCAWTVVGLAYCWGSNIAGQLGAGAGDGGAAKRSVMNLPAAVRSLAVGTFHVCAILIDGRVVCWGSNQGNALGDGTNLDSLTPTYVRTSSTCYQLTLARAGNGALPVANSLHSDGCPASHYVAGTVVSLAALPNAQHRVHSWSAPVAFMAGEMGALLSMPAADTTATVTYAACRQLTRSHTGSGANPVAVPGASSGCAQGRYAPGDTIGLTALPDANQRIKAWSGATLTPGLAQQGNTVVMPAADHTVAVTYEACNTLSTSVTGKGDAILIAPAASQGCLGSAFVAGEQVALLANPAPGWTIGGWTGTANNDNTTANNLLTMPAGDAQAGVRYVTIAPGGEERVLLPIVNK